MVLQVKRNIAVEKLLNRKKKDNDKIEDVRKAIEGEALQTKATASDIRQQSIASEEDKKRGRQGASEIATEKLRVATQEELQREGQAFIRDRERRIGQLTEQGLTQRQAHVQATKELGGEKGIGISNGEGGVLGEDETLRQVGFGEIEENIQTAEQEARKIGVTEPITPEELELAPVFGEGFEVLKQEGLIGKALLKGGLLGGLGGGIVSQLGKKISPALGVGAGGVIGTSREFFQLAEEQIKLEQAKEFKSFQLSRENIKDIVGLAEIAASEGDWLRFDTMLTAYNVELRKIRIAESRLKLETSGSEGLFKFLGKEGTELMEIGDFLKNDNVRTQENLARLSRSPNFNFLEIRARQLALEV